MNHVQGRHIHRFDPAQFSQGALHRAWLHLINNGIGESVRVPMLVARGKHDGPVLGLTAALHGNELNGVRVIQKLFDELDVQRLRGTVVGVLAANVPAVLREQRVFNDGVDLNRISPGRANGNQSEVYIHRFVDRIVGQFNYLLDLHTASAGRVNSFYIRADMTDPETARLARLQNAEIILNDLPDDYTLRGTAASLGAQAITIELCDPSQFQRDVIASGLEGVKNVLVDLGMTEGKIMPGDQPTLFCSTSRWLYTDEGGILTVLPEVNDRLKKDQHIATVKDIFGHTVKTFKAPDDGIVIGKSINPINQTGSRILHLGFSPEPLDGLETTLQNHA